MGRPRVRAVVYNLDDEGRSQEIELIVDTDVTYSVIPTLVAERLGIQVSEEITFTPTKKGRRARKVGWAGLAYDGRKTHTRVVLGGDEDIPLLGAFALEGLGYEVDPIAKALRPATRFLPHEREKRILETEEFIPLDKA